VPTTIPTPAVASGIEAIGYHDLDGRPCIKMAMHVVDDRWYLYLGPLWEPGLLILDVTDPADPQLVRRLDGPANTWTFQVQAADGLLIQGLERIEGGWGLTPEDPSEEGIWVWDLSDPTDPQRLSHWQTGSEHGTHRNFYAGGRYAHLCAGAPGFYRHLYRIVDLEDPRRPVEAGRWWLPEQWLAGGATPKPFSSVHGPPWVVGDRAYISYMKAGMVILDISDIATPRLVSRLDFGDAFGSMIGVHTVMPIPERGIAVVSTESIHEQGSQIEPLNLTVIVDISDETSPRVISWVAVPTPPADAPFDSFHRKGGRFGPHNLHHGQGHPDLDNRDDRLYQAYFNAGLRVYDIADPYEPREIAFYVPPDPTQRRGLLPTDLTTQSEDVLVDRRGVMYVTDKNWGLHILRMAES
jgi:hypothetical protein